MREFAAATSAWARRQPVLFVFVLALGVRVLSAIVLTATVGMENHFPDSRGYDSLASLWANGADVQDDFFFERLSGYVLPLGVLYRVFGDHLFLGQLLAAVMGAITAALVCRLILEVSTGAWALFGGLIIALFPSQVLWSSVAFKDSTIWAVTVLIALLLVHANRTRGWALLGYAVTVAALLFWLGHLRWSTFIVVSWGLVLAAALSPWRGWILRMVGAVTIAAVIPWYVGTGAFGLDYARAVSPAEVRAGGASAADTAFVDDDPSERTNDLVHLPRGLAVVLLEPYPWTTFSGFEVRLAQAELIVWYPLLLFAAAGVASYLRRLRTLVFVGFVAGVLLVVYALYEGNFGTAFRHRAELVPGLAVLAAFGAPVLLGWWQRRAISQRVRAGSAQSA